MKSTNEAFVCGCQCDCGVIDPQYKGANRAVPPSPGSLAETRGEPIVRAIGGMLAIAAVLAGAGLLAGDLVAGMAGRAAHAPLSAAPLLIVGAAFMMMLPLARPGPVEWVKRAMVGAAFILWGVAQLMPPGAAATTLGDLVIMLYVIDLALVIRDWGVAGALRM